MVGLGFDVSAADEPGGAELCSFAPPDVSELWPSVDFLALAAPEDGGAELCSAAPPEVSAEPVSAQSLACAASGETPAPVGGVEDSSALTPAQDQATEPRPWWRRDGSSWTLLGHPSRAENTDRIGWMSPVPSRKCFTR